jgi:hypothetical protein
LNNCITKELIYKDSLGINKNEFVRVNIEFGDIIQDENPTGLYIVRFPNAEDIEFNGRLNKPILFGVINSHVTMKVSRTGE